MKALNRLLHSWLPVGLLLSAALLGCSSKGPKNSVTGKITLGDKPVTGTVTFIGPGGQEVSGVAGNGGVYTIDNPTPGENKITIKPIPGAVVGGGGPAPSGAALPGMESSQTPQPVNPPPKYASPDNGLKFNVTGGKQTNDLALTP